MFLEEHVLRCIKICETDVLIFDNLGQLSVPFPSLLPKQLRDPVHTTSVFARLLKTFLFSQY